MRLADLIDKISPSLEKNRSDIKPDDGYVKAASLVLLSEIDNEACFGLTLRTPHLDAHAGQVSFPGGRLEAGEGPIDAAIREAHEEVGLSRELITVSGVLAPMKTHTTKFFVWPVIAFIDNPNQNWVLQGDEVAEFFWAPVSLFLNASHRSLRTEILPNEQKGRPAVYYERHEIWGLTLRMIDQLLPPLIK